MEERLNAGERRLGDPGLTLEEMDAAWEAVKKAARP
jgi:hypothetical protein